MIVCQDVKTHGKAYGLESRIWKNQSENQTSNHLNLLQMVN